MQVSKETFLNYRAPDGSSILLNNKPDGKEYSIWLEDNGVAINMIYKTNADGSFEWIRIADKAEML